MRKTTNINIKLLALTILPLVIALSAVLLVSQYEFRSLAEQAEQTYRQNVLNHKKREIRHYMELVRGTIASLDPDNKLTEQDFKTKLRFALNNMRYGNDGYFFVYDYQGNSVILPGQEWREGKNWFAMRDANGVALIQSLIEQAQAGGGFTTYLFNQPSRNGQHGKKLSYAEPIQGRPWIIGTGVYIDNIDKQVSKLNTDMQENTQRTLFVSLFIGALAVVIVFTSGMLLRVSQSRLANKKLRELNERIFQTQEEESRRFSRELHDGVSQTIAATRFSLETALLKVNNNDNAVEDIELAVDLTRKIMADIRLISHQLHPRILEDHGLSAALDNLGQEFAKRTDTKVTVERLPVSDVLSNELRAALYRIAQEALTNIERHAQATAVNISLRFDKAWLVLEVQDNGCGFDYSAIHRSAESKTGIGLRNMTERLNYYNGYLDIQSRATGTTILAYIPKRHLKYNNEQLGSL